MAATMVQPNLYTNALVPHPIGKLPLEMLEQVFIEYASDAYHPSNAEMLLVNSYDTAPDWINITYVCHLWRAISLACPHLWTHITTNLSHRWVSELLKRSRKHPLILELSTFHSDFRDIIAVISTNAFRIKELYIGAGGATAQALGGKLHGQLTAPVPLLEKLVLEVGQCKVQEDLFSGYAPRLRRLWLGDTMTISITSPLLGHLRELEVQEIYEANDLLKLLQHTPLLESLKVRVVNRQHSGDVIHLPHLSRLCIDLYGYQTFVSFFEPLQIPPTVHFQLTLRVRRGPSIGEWYEAMLDVIADRVRGISRSVGPLYAKVEIEPKKDWCIAWYPNPTVDRRPRRALPEYDGGWNRQCEPQCDALFKFSMLYSSPRTYAAMMNGVQCMVDRLVPLAVVRALQWHLTSPEDPEDVEPLSAKGSLRCENFEAWVPILSAMSGVRILRLTSDAIAGILRTLTPDDNARRSSRTPLLPNLSTLAIVNCGLPDPEFSTFYDYLHRVDIVQALEVFLSKRLKCGLQLERLSINTDDDDDLEDIEYLRRYVKDVTYENYAQAHGEQVKSIRQTLLKEWPQHDSVGAEH